MPRGRSYRRRNAYPQFKRGVRVRVKPDWAEAHQHGEVLCAAVYVSQWWVPVLWDGEEDPDWFKAAGLEIE